MSRTPTGVDRVALVLAIGISVALLSLCALAFYGATIGGTPGASLIAITQVLTGWGGGSLGVLGAYVGYRAGERRADRNE